MSKKKSPDRIEGQWKPEPWRLALFYPERRQWVGGVIVPVTRQVIDKGVHSEETRIDTCYPDDLAKGSGATVAEIQALIASAQYAYTRLVEIATMAAKRTEGNSLSRPKVV